MTVFSTPNEYWSLFSERCGIGDADASLRGRSKSRATVIEVRSARSQSRFPLGRKSPARDPGARHIAAIVARALQRASEVSARR
jgi:hypothetical protein